MAFVSDHEPEDTHGKLVGRGDLAAQARQVFGNLGYALAAAGARPELVSKITVRTRLRSDEEVVQRLRATVIGSPTAGELASLPRYLLAAGALDTALSEHCSSRLQEESRRALPRAGYDAIENQVRAISQSLLDVLARSFST